MKQRHGTMKVRVLAQPGHRKTSRHRARITASMFIRQFSHDSRP